MTQNEQKVLELLMNLGIEYKRVEHPPVYTVDEAKRLCTFVETGCNN